MPLGSLLGASAYEVAPGQTQNFEGGEISNLAEVAEGLNDASAKGKLETGVPVSLRLNANRTSPVRDTALKAGFGTTAQLLTSSQLMAERLGGAMDQRSAPCLLVVSSHLLRERQRQVVFWTFPRERVIMRSRGKVDLEDAFSLNSRLRKAALLWGGQTRTGFLIARVLDYQTTSTDRSVADFWIDRFLDARLQIDGEQGTNILAKVLRKANDQLVGEPEQAELHTAIAAVRTHSRSRWSVEDFATDLMPKGKAREAVLKAAGDGEETAAPFELNVARFDELVEYHVYELENGVRVSAPFSQIGDGVKIDADRKLVATGVIKSEKLRASAQ